MGRPKWEPTAEQVENARAFARRGLTEAQIAHNLGISPDTLIQVKKRNPEFAEAIKAGQAEGIAMVSNALFNQALAGNTVAMLFFLKCRDGGNWRDTPREVDQGDEIRIPAHIAARAVAKKKAAAAAKKRAKQPTTAKDEA